MLKSTLAQHVSDSIKDEEAISQRFPWLYLHDLFHLLMAQLLPAQKQLNELETLALIRKVIKKIKDNPFSLSQYLNIAPTKRKQVLKSHLRQYAFPIITAEIRKKSKISKSRRPYRNWFQRLFGLA